jgi:drug/metabolite transporter (DMT)-like permease
MNKLKFGIDTLAFVLLPFLAVAGAWFSRKIKFAGGHWSITLMLVISLLSSIAWILISKYTKMSLALATIIFDAVCGLSYFLAFVAMGESVTPLQGFGVVLAMIGMVLMSL